MSQENVEIVWRGFDAYGQGGVAAVVDFYAEHCVVEDFPEMPDRADYAVAVMAMTGRALGSGAPLDALAVFVHELRDGKIVRDRAFTSKSQALEAVGLSE